MATHQKCEKRRIKTQKSGRWRQNFSMDPDPADGASTCHPKRRQRPCKQSQLLNCRCFELRGINVGWWVDSTMSSRKLGKTEIMQTDSATTEAEMQLYATA